MSNLNLKKIVNFFVLSLKFTIRVNNSELTLHWKILKYAYEIELHTRGKQVFNRKIMTI